VGEVQTLEQIRDEKFKSDVYEEEEVKDDNCRTSKPSASSGGHEHDKEISHEGGLMLIT
jgi:hypothetical protein